MTMNKSNIPLQVRSAWECCWERLNDFISDVLYLLLNVLKTKFLFFHQGVQT